MLVDSTQSTTRLPNEVGVSTRTASLSSSSNQAQPGSRTRTEATGEEGTTRSRSVEDSLVLSTAVEARDPQAVSSPTQPEAQAEATPVNDVQDNKIGQPGSFIEQRLDETRSREEERIEELKNNISEELNQNLKLRFSTDEETGADVFQLIEEDTGDVVRQIPSQEILEFMQKFQNSVSGLLVSEQA